MKAPASAPVDPAGVTPPLVPFGTVRPDHNKRGGVRLRPPTEVAQVSAAAAARLAVTSQIRSR
jgi:hypothetical protein